MGRPKEGYRLADGTEAPGVTTITGRFKEANGLIAWAHRLGKEGLDWRAERDAAGDVGTLAHDLIERFLAGAEVMDAIPGAQPEAIAAACQRFLHWRNWYRQSNPTVVASEVSLVSEAHRFGGTLDAVVEMGGEYIIADWKTGKGIYPETLLQLAAYKLLWEGWHPDKLIAGFCVVHVTDGGAQPIDLPILPEAEMMFLALRHAYDLDRPVTAALKRAVKESARKVA